MPATAGSAAAVTGAQRPGHASGGGGGGQGGGGHGNRNDGDDDDGQPSILLVSKPPLPAFTIPYPQPPPETRVSELRRAIIDIYVPSQAQQVAVTYAEQLRLTTLTSWRLGALALDLHQNTLIDPETRADASAQVGYRLEDDHECALIEDGDEIHISLKPGCELSELQLPDLGRDHVYAAPSNVVKLSRKGTLSQPPPYSLLAPAEPSSHSSSVAGHPTANYHSHNYATDWRSPFRVVTASGAATNGRRREARVADPGKAAASAPRPNAAVNTAPGPATTSSVLRHMPGSSNPSVVKKPSRRKVSQPGVRVQPSSSGSKGYSRIVASATSGSSALPPPKYSATASEALNLPPTARVIGLGVQGTAGRRRSGSRQNSSSSGTNAAGLVPLATGHTVDGPSLTATTSGEPSRVYSTEPDTYILHTSKAGAPNAPSARTANGSGTRRSSGASREGKIGMTPSSGPANANTTTRPTLQKHMSSGHPSHLSSSSQTQSATASATAAFLSAPVSHSTPPIVNLSPFPDQIVLDGALGAAGTGGAAATAAAPSVDVSDAMLKHLRRARNSFTASPPADGDVEAHTPRNSALDDGSEGSGSGSLPSDKEGGGGGGGLLGSRSRRGGGRRKSSKGKGKSRPDPSASPPSPKDPGPARAAAAADRRYRDVQQALQREIAKQHQADTTRASQIASEAARREEAARKREEEERRSAVREKWELWEEVKKREKREMKERRRRGEEVPGEALLGPAPAPPGDKV